MELSTSSLSGRFLTLFSLLFILFLSSFFYSSCFCNLCCILHLSFLNFTFSFLPYFLYSGLFIPLLRFFFIFLGEFLCLCIRNVPPKLWGLHVVWKFPLSWLMSRSSYVCHVKHPVENLIWDHSENGRVGSVIVLWLLFVSILSLNSSSAATNITANKWVQALIR